RTVLVTITWGAVNENGGVAEADAQAIETFPADPLASATVRISPPEQKGTSQLSLSFNDTTPFGTVQWQLYNFGHIAPVKAGMLDAPNFPSCPYSEHAECIGRYQRPATPPVKCTPAAACRAARRRRNGLLRKLRALACAE